MSDPVITAKTYPSCPSDQDQLIPLYASDETEALKAAESVGESFLGAKKSICEQNGDYYLPKSILEAASGKYTRVQLQENLIPGLRDVVKGHRSTLLGKECKDYSDKLLELETQLYADSMEIPVLTRIGIATLSTALMFGAVVEATDDLYSRLFELRGGANSPFVKDQSGRIAQRIMGNGMLCAPGGNVPDMKELGESAARNLIHNRLIGAAASYAMIMGLEIIYDAFTATQSPPDVPLDSPLLPAQCRPDGTLPEEKVGSFDDNTPEVGLLEIFAKLKAKYGVLDGRTQGITKLNTELATEIKKHQQVDYKKAADRPKSTAAVYASRLGTAAHEFGPEVAPVLMLAFGPFSKRLHQFYDRVSPLRHSLQALKSRLMSEALTKATDDLAQQVRDGKLVSCKGEVSKEELLKYIEEAKKILEGQVKAPQSVAQMISAPAVVPALAPIGQQSLSPGLIPECSSPIEVQIAQALGSPAQSRFPDLTKSIREFSEADYLSYVEAGPQHTVATSIASSPIANLFEVEAINWGIPMAYQLKSNLPSLEQALVSEYAHNSFEEGVIRRGMETITSTLRNSGTSAIPLSDSIVSSTYWALRQFVRSLDANLPVEATRLHELIKPNGIVNRFYNIRARQGWDPSELKPVEDFADTAEEYWEKIDFRASLSAKEIAAYEEAAYRRHLAQQFGPHAVSDMYPSSEPMPLFILPLPAVGLMGTLFGGAAATSATGATAAEQGIQWGWGLAPAF